MMQRYIPMLISLVLSVLASVVIAADLPNFQDAIYVAHVKSGSDHRPDLRRCIKLWSVLKVKRTTFYDKLGWNVLGNVEKDKIILEIGNSGFPRYDYIYITGNRMISSFGSSIDLSKYSFGEILVELYAGRAQILSGNASDDTEDGNCYFLTVIGNNTKNSVAVYGELKSTFTDLLIAYLVDMARIEGTN